MKLKFTMLLLAVVLFAFSPICNTASAAFTVDLSWDPSPSNPADLVYTVHYGNESGHYDKSSARVTATNLSINTLTAGTWYFVVKARYGDGPESAPSNEVSITLNNSTSRVVLDFDGDGKSDSVVIRRAKKGSRKEFRTLLSSTAYALKRPSRTSSSLVFNSYPSGGLLFTLSAARTRLNWRATTGKPRVRASLRGRFNYALSGCDFDGDGSGDFAGFKNSEAVLQYISSVSKAIVSVPLALPSAHTVSDFYCADVVGGDAIAELFALLTDAQGAQKVAILGSSGALLREVILEEKGASSLIVPAPLENGEVFLTTLRRDDSTGLISDFFFRKLSTQAPSAVRWHLDGGADDASPGIFALQDSQVTFAGLEMIVGDTLTRFDMTPLAEGALPSLKYTRKLSLPALKNVTGVLMRPVSVVRTKNK